MATKICPAGPILAAKVVWGQPILTKISPEIGPARPTLRGINFEMTGQRSIGIWLDQ